MMTTKPDMINILLIEDNPGDARMIEEMLVDVRHASFRVERAERLATGLSRLQLGNQFDVVLTDLGLPDSQGWETFARLHERVPEMPIIVLTGLDDEAVAIKAISDGAQDYLVKGQVKDNLLSRSIRYAIERKRAEAERAALLAQLRAQVQQVAHILDTMPVGVVLLDREGWVLLANPMSLRVSPTLIDIAIGGKLTHVGEAPFAAFIAAPLAGSWQEIADDTHVFQVIARPFDSAEDSALGEWVIVIDDVTEKRAVQEQLQRQERLAAVGQLAAGIAHDFNNILSIISIQATLAADTPDLLKRVRDRLAIIGEQTGVATTLIQQILDFGRRAILNRQVLDLCVLLETQVKLLRRILPENILIEFTCAPGECIITADSTRIQQMLMNLAVNARDAMPQGGNLHIALSRETIPQHRGMSHGDCVRLEIADTGTGIVPEAMPHLFEPFFTTKPRGRGTGLGLAQVYGIVKQHGGEIDTHSVLGQGTTFTIYLPAEMSPIIERSTSDEYHEDRSGHGESILLVEDNELLLEAMGEMIEMLGYAVIEARNGSEALALLDRADVHVDLVLTDLIMPTMGGDALLVELHQRGLRTPVVILSGHPLTGELGQLMAIGLTGWLLKPTSRDELSQMLASALGR